MDRYDKVEIEKFIISAADDKYRDFNSKLTKTAYLLNGVRVPWLLYTDPTQRDIAGESMPS
ncbi:MAG: hypothetical protein K2P32_05600, partial [Clostridia bacterium]|nr:hypothetical protein [Clostridia bacterium]